MKHALVGFLVDALRVVVWNRHDERRRVVFASSLTVCVDDRDEKDACVAYLDGFFLLVESRHFDDECSKTAWVEFFWTFDGFLGVVEDAVAEVLNLLWFRKASHVVVGVVVQSDHILWMMENCLLGHGVGRSVFIRSLYFCDPV